MNRDRVQHAISVMERVRDNKLPFDMRDWFLSQHHAEDCGTPACFTGWMARDERCRSEGFYITSGGVLGSSFRIGGYKIPYPCFQGDSGSLAIASYLDITPDESDMLVFLSAGYRNIYREKVVPDDVIRLLKLLLEHGKLTKEIIYAPTPEAIT